MGQLLLVRHGESEWNALHKLTGQANIGLTELGKLQARSVAQKLKTIPIDIIYTSALKRAKQTYAEIKQIVNLDTVPLIENAVLNERDFGLLTGQQKDTILLTLGKDDYNAIVKGWHKAAPNGESLQDVYKRVVEYYDNTIKKDIVSGKTVLIVSHHHVLRTLIKHLEDISNDDITLLRLNNADVVSYTLDNKAKIITKQLLV